MKKYIVHKISWKNWEDLQGSLAFTIPRTINLSMACGTSNPTVVASSWKDITCKRCLKRKPMKGKRVKKNEGSEKPGDHLITKVQKHMGWTLAKTFLWFFSTNPLLGNCSPNEMIAKGREHKLEKFIDGCIEESTPLWKATP